MQPTSEITSPMRPFPMLLIVSISISRWLLYNSFVQNLHNQINFSFSFSLEKQRSLLLFNLIIQQHKVKNTKNSNYSTDFKSPKLLAPITPCWTFTMPVLFVYETKTMTKQIQKSKYETVVVPDWYTAHPRP